MQNKVEADFVNRTLLYGCRMVHGLRMKADRAWHMEWKAAALCHFLLDFIGLTALLWSKPPLFDVKRPLSGAYQQK